MKDYSLLPSLVFDEFERALNRMCGEFQPDGSTDALFDITRAITSGYYYVPSKTELLQLPQMPVLDISALEIKPSIIPPIPKLKIIAEYCTNCGYKTIFLEKKKDYRIHRPRSGVGH